MPASPAPLSAYHGLVLNSVCRSNHHRIAVMALQHLEADDAGMWRDLFLKYHTTFLTGAKAPDEEFKDFKNHVCHPEDNFWGGAPQASREWYRRTVRALQAEDWEHAAWNAGVMSHYLVDPCQPFHTGQSEAEAVIHRAAEYSYSKAFPELKLIIDQHVGWPTIAIQDREDWVEQMVRDAAVNAHQHYHTLIDHYDIEAGRKKPELALDQEAKDVVAGQIAYATVMLAKVMDKAIAEAAVAAPKVNLVLATVAVGLKKPLHVVLKKIDSKADKKVVKAQYEEYRRSGKVRHTMADDDMLVRQLHAEEVTERHLSSVDCEWPREHGTLNGTGAEPRVHKKVKVKKDKAAKAIDGETEAREGASNIGPAALDSKRPRIRLTREAPVVDAPAIGPKTASRFTIIGVNTVADLLALTPEDAAKKIKASHINARQIKDWQAQALLACTVPEISGTVAQLLVGAGIHSADDLAHANPNDLIDMVQEFARSKDGVAILRSSAPPDGEKVKSWIAAAQSIAA